MREAEPQRPHQRHEQADADEQPEQRVVERDAVPAVARDVARVLARVHLVGGDLLVEADVAELHAPEAELCRAVRVVGRVGGGVVPAMHRHPLTRTHTGADPEKDAERQRGRRLDGQRPVREATVEVDGRGGDGELGHEGGRDKGGDQLGDRHGPKRTTD